MTEVFNLDVEACKFIKSHEGCIPKVYRDTNNIPTIGIGFNLTRPNSRSLIEYVGANFYDILSGKTDLTNEQIDSLFTLDVQNAIIDAKKFTKSFDNHPNLIKLVLVDMVFNLGLARLNKFKKFKAALEEFNYLNVADEMMNSKWYKQVKSRSAELVSIVLLIAGKRNERKTS